MDELTPLGENLSHPFGESFNSILDEAHRQLLNEAPLHLLPIVNLDSDDVAYDTTNDIAYVLVPEKFIRIAKFKFTNWTNPATKFITQEHPDYKQIENGLVVRNIVKPIIVLEYSIQEDIDDDPQRYLKCFSVDKVVNIDPVEYLFYISEGDVNLLEDKVADALIWLATSKLMQVFKIKEFEIAEGRYKEFLLTNMK